MGAMQVRGPFTTGSCQGAGSPPGKFRTDGWMRTGDVATMDELGFVCTAADGTQDLTPSGGEWISSVDLENAVMAHAGVAEAAVILSPPGQPPATTSQPPPGWRRWNVGTAPPSIASRCIQPWSTSRRTVSCAVITPSIASRGASTNTDSRRGV